MSAIRNMTMVALILAAMPVAACAAPTEEVGESEAAATSNGTKRPERTILIQAEHDQGQTAFFKSRGATIISSYEAGIWWTARDAQPTVQQKFDALIDKYLARLEGSVGENETIILALAGHSSGTSFAGKAVTAQGNMNRVVISQDTVRGIVSRYPRIAKNVRALFLLGCNAGHEDKMNLWRGFFPNVTAVAGFNSPAPASGRGANELVRWSLGRWAALGILNRDAVLPTDDAVLFKGMDECRASKCLGVVSNVSLGGRPHISVLGSPAWQLVVDGEAHWDAIYAPDSATTVAAKLALLENDYAAYLAADAAHADPPLDTTSGLVRVYNTLAQQYLSIAGDAATPRDRARVSQSIRLMLFRDLKAEWISDNRALVVELGLDPDALVRGTRRDAVLAINALAPAMKTSPAGRRIARALIDLDPAELPDSML